MQVFVQFTENNDGEYTEWNFSGIFRTHPFPGKTDSELQEMGLAIEEHEIQEA